MLAIVGLVEGGLADTRPAARAAAAAAAAIPLIWRRSIPALAALAALPLAIGSGVGINVDDQLAPFLCLMIGLFSIGLHGNRRQLAVGLSVGVVLGGTSVVLSGAPADLAYLGTLVAIAVVPARLLRHRLQEVERLTEQKLRAEAEIESRARIAASEERTRVARELHDIIGHGVSLMVVHAAAAEAHLADSATARHSLKAVQDTGRQAVADLARLLGLLRDDHTEMGHAPQPGIADLEDLVAVARESGEDVELRVEGAVEQVPSTVGLTVYRIAQEALTNARRHAPGAAVRAHIKVAPRGVEVNVVNSASSSPAPTRVAGHGLAGLRERVAMFGGTLQFGEAPDGGFAVSAEVPVA